MRMKFYDEQEYEVTLKKGRELTELGDLGVRRQLHHMRSDNAVFWSDRGNSYVACLVPGNRELCGRSNFGDSRFVVLSINGLGEIRWYVEVDPRQYSGDQMGQVAVSYFFDVKEV